MITTLERQVEHLRMSGSHVPRDKVDRALPYPALTLCNPGPVSYPLCASCFLVLMESLCLLSKMWVKKKNSHMLHPGNGRCRYQGEKIHLSTERWCVEQTAGAQERVG